MAGQAPQLIDPVTGRKHWQEAPSNKQQDERATGNNKVPRWMSNWQTITKYTQSLAMNLRRAGYLIDPDYSLSQDADAIDKMMRDPIINFAVNFRKRLVAGREWSLEAKYEQYKPYVGIFTDLMKRIKGFVQSRFILSEAIFQGISAARFDGCIDYLKLEGTNQYMKWWLPRRLRPVDKRRLRREFVIVPLKNGLVEYKYAWTIFDPEQRAWYVVQHPEWYFWFAYNDEEDRLGYGKGLYDALYVPWYIKSNLLQYGLQWAERWAEPWIDVALEAEAGDTDALDARAEAYMALIKMMRAARVLTHDNRDRMELKEAATGSQDIIGRMGERMDEATIKVCLSSTLTTGTGEYGSRAHAEVHQNSQDSAVQYDRMVFEESHDDHLLNSMWLYNRVNLFKLGYQNVPWECPLQFKLQREKKWQMEEQEKLFRMIKDLGIGGIRKEDFFERFDLVEAGDDDEVLEMTSNFAEPAPGPGVGQPPGPMLQTYQAVPQFFAGQTTRTEAWLAGAR